MLKRLKSKLSPAYRKPKPMRKHDVLCQCRRCVRAEIKHIMNMQKEFDDGRP
jgi:hypothetical protein